MNPTLEVKMLAGEYWWGGSADDGVQMPFSAETCGYVRDFRVSAPNQTMPLYLSSCGRYVWSEHPFRVRIDGGVLFFEGRDITLNRAGDTLRAAYLAAESAHFPFVGSVPPRAFFETAQYNTWMEFTYTPTQSGVLSYAHAILENGFKPGIFIIDEGWHLPYGDWRFDPVNFPDPAGMVAELHRLGFRVMLWVVPYVTASGARYMSSLRKDRNPDGYDRLYMRNEAGEPALVRWWNGVCAILDLSNPVDAAFLDDQLRALIRDYGIDGFKFDGGDLGAYSNVSMVNGCYRGTADGTYDPAEKNLAWNAFGTRYAYHEYKDTFKGGGKPVIQRLRDRNHSWTNDGIDTIIPNSLAQGLIGHPFICPDMIGGGEWSYNRPGFRVDEELFVRMAQVSVFFPMMQFSWAPWRVLSPEHLAIVRECANLHARLAPELYDLIQASAKSGEPILRPLCYSYPHAGYEKVTDEYLCGENLLVCPVVTKGTRRKELIFPAGDWVDEDGNRYAGGRHTVETPLEKLAWFRRKE